MAGTWDDGCLCLVHSPVPVPVPRRQARSRRSALSSHHHRSPPLAPPYHCQVVCLTISASMFSPLRMIANNSGREPRHVAKTAAVRRHGRLLVRRRYPHGCRPPAPRPSVPPRPSGLLPIVAHLNWANPLWDAGSCRRQVRCSCCSPWPPRGELPRTAPIGGASTKPTTLPRPPPLRAPPSAETPPVALLRGPPPSCSTSAVDACFFCMVSRHIALTQPSTSHA